MAGQHFFDISKDAAAAGSGRADAEYFIQSVPVNFGADTRAGQERLQFRSKVNGSRLLAGRIEKRLDSGAVPVKKELVFCRIHDCECKDSIDPADKIGTPGQIGV